MDEKLSGHTIAPPGETAFRMKTEGFILTGKCVKPLALDMGKDSTVTDQRERTIRLTVGP